MEAPDADEVSRDAARLRVAVRPDGLPLGPRHPDDLERADDALAARVSPFEVLEGEVDGGAEVHGVEAQAEVERRLAAENFVDLVPNVRGRMACGLGHAATPFRFER
jgi:hypothetical protein